MKSILLVTTCMQCGGAERVLSVLANHYIKLGWRVTIIMLLSDLVEYKLAEDVHLVCLNQKKWTKYLAIPLDVIKLHKYIAKEKPDTVLSFTVKTNLVTLLASCSTKSRVIISERNDPLKDCRGAIVRFLANRLYSKADAVIFQTKYAESCFKQRIVEKGRIIANPIIDLAPYIGQRRKAIYSAGRLVESKNFDFLIRSFKILHEKLPEHTLEIYGEGPLSEHLQTLINDLKLQDVVVLKGHDSNLHDKVKDTQLFVLATKREGMPNAVLEAMALAIPCVCTRYDGIEEIINDSNGVIIEPNNEQIFADSLYGLLSDVEKWKTMSKQAYYASERFRLDNVIDKWESVLGK